MMARNKGKSNGPIGVSNAQFQGMQILKTESAESRQLTKIVLAFVCCGRSDCGVHFGSTIQSYR